MFMDVYRNFSDSNSPAIIMDRYIVNSSVEEADDEENILINDDDEFSTYFTDQKINVPESNTVWKEKNFNMTILCKGHIMSSWPTTDDDFRNRE